VHRRLCKHYEIAHRRAKRNEYPRKWKRAKILSDKHARRHKTNAYAGEEDYKTKIGVDESHANFAKCASGKLERENLKYEKQADKRQHGKPYFLHIFRKRVEEFAEKSGYSIHLCDFRRLQARAFRFEKKAQKHYRIDRPDTADCGKPKAVVLTALAAAHRRYAYAEREYEGDGKWPGGNAARIKRNREVFLRYKHAEDEKSDICHAKKLRHTDAKEYAKHCKYEKYAEPQSHHEGQNVGRHAGHLPCEDLQIRLCNRYHCAHQQRREDNQPYFARTREVLPEVFAYWHHRKVCAKGE